MSTFGRAGSDEPGEDVLGAFDMAAHQGDRAVRFALLKQRNQLAMLVVGAGQNLVGMRDPRDQLTHLPHRLADRGVRTCRPKHAETGTAVEVEIFGEWVGGEVATEPLLDPRGERIRA